MLFFQKASKLIRQKKNFLVEIILYKMLYKKQKKASYSDQSRTSNHESTDKDFHID